MKESPSTRKSWYRSAVSPAATARVSVVPAIDGFNGLFRFVQQSRQRCNEDDALLKRDALDDFTGGRHEHFTRFAADDVHVGGAGLEHIVDGAEFLATFRHNAQADQFVDEVGLFVVAQNFAVRGFEEFAAKGLDLGAVFEAFELEDPGVAILPGAEDDAAYPGDEDRAAALEVSRSGREGCDAQFAAEGMGTQNPADGGVAGPGFSRRCGDVCPLRARWPLRARLV